MGCRSLDLQMTSVVYIVRIGRHLKIGVTRRLGDRLQAFRNAALDVELLLSIPGDRTLERRIHELLAESRITRELFRNEWRPLWFIDAVRRDGLSAALHWLAETTPKRRHEQKLEEHKKRLIAARQSKAELNAHFAALVADRRHRLGW
jgi:hypothetical protein